jgi:hypothetical protein
MPDHSPLTRKLISEGLKPPKETVSVVGALRALLEETAKIRPMPTGLGLARYQGLEALERLDPAAAKALRVASEANQNLAAE